MGSCGGIVDTLVPLFMLTAKILILKDTVP